MVLVVRCITISIPVYVLTPAFHIGCKYVESPFVHPSFQDFEMIELDTVLCKTQSAILYLSL